MMLVRVRTVYIGELKVGDTVRNTTWAARCARVCAGQVWGWGTYVRGKCARCVQASRALSAPHRMFYGGARV